MVLLFKGERLVLEAGGIPEYNVVPLGAARNLPEPAVEEVPFLGRQRQPVGEKVHARGPGDVGCNAILLVRAREQPALDSREEPAFIWALTVHLLGEKSSDGRDEGAVELGEDDEGKGAEAGADPFLSLLSIKKVKAGVLVEDGGGHAMQ